MWGVLRVPFTARQASGIRLAQEYTQLMEMPPSPPRAICAGAPPAVAPWTADGGCGCGSVAFLARETPPDRSCQGNLSVDCCRQQQTLSLDRTNRLVVLVLSAMVTDACRRIRHGVAAPKPA